MAVFETLGRMMGPRDKLRLHCQCGHDTGWTRPQAFRLFGQGATPYDVRRLTRCTGCGKRGQVDCIVEPWTPRPGRAKVANDV
jgi:hypothetical protein